MITALRSRAELELDRFALDPYCKFYLPLWKLDGDSFADHSAYGHLCTNYGSLWTPQGRSFDGVDDYVDCGNDTSLNITDAITLEAWVRTSDTSKDDQIIVGQIDTSIINRNYNLINTFGRIKFEHGDGVNSETFTTNNIVVDGTWQHIVFTGISKGATKIYVNGVVVKAGILAYDIVNTTTVQKNIGGWFAGYFNGLIDEVRIYSRALTPREILDHYIIGKEMFG